LAPEVGSTEAGLIPVAHGWGGVWRGARVGIAGVHRRRAFSDVRAARSAADEALTLLALEGLAGVRRLVDGALAVDDLDADTGHAVGAVARLEAEAALARGHRADLTRGTRLEAEPVVAAHVARAVVVRLADSHTASVDAIEAGFATQALEPFLVPRRLAALSDLATDRTGRVCRWRRIRRARWARWVVGRVGEAGADERPRAALRERVLLARIVERAARKAEAAGRPTERPAERAERTDRTLVAWVDGARLTLFGDRRAPPLLADGLLVLGALEPLGAACGRAALLTAAQQREAHRGEYAGPVSSAFVVPHLNLPATQPTRTQDGRESAS